MDLATLGRPQKWLQMDPRWTPDGAWMGPGQASDGYSSALQGKLQQPFCALQERPGRLCSALQEKPGQPFCAMHKSPRAFLVPAGVTRAAFV